MSDMMPATKVPTANPVEKLSISVIIPTNQAHCHKTTNTQARIFALNLKRKSSWQQQGRHFFHRQSQTLKMVFLAFKICLNSFMVLCSYVLIFLL